MRNIIKTFRLNLFLCFFLFATPAWAEEISNFSVVYTVHQDGTVSVTENIQYDFGTELRHGIFRTLETRHPQEASEWYKRRVVKIEDIEVQADGQSVPTQISNESGQLKIKIGDDDKTISSSHVYTLSYVLSGALSYGPEGAEFYWNVTGNKWPVVINSVQATVVDPSGVLLAPSADCYLGAVGSTARCDVRDVAASSSLFSTANLPAYSGLTIAQALNADQLDVLIAENISWYGSFLILLEKFALLLYLAAGIWFINLLVLMYRLRTKYAISRPVVAQYEPYEGCLPMYTGVLFDNKLHPQDITAGIVYLAEQGYIKIRKIDIKILGVFDASDYEITLLKSINTFLASATFTPLDLFFYSNAEVGTKILLSDIPQSIKESNYGTLQHLKNNLHKALVTDGFMVSYSQRVKTSGKLVLVTVVFSLLMVLLMPKVAAAYLVVSLLVVILVNTGLRTTKGNEALNHLQGFKLFLSVTDKERFDFHNAPEKSPELFMKYLPYAIALGVEEKWEKVFVGITIPTPSWYESNTAGTFSAAAFSANDLTNNLGAFSNAITNSSGVSGSSGGGFSGGGGGGGGGGSW